MTCLDAILDIIKKFIQSFVLQILKSLICSAMIGVKSHRGSEHIMSINAHQSMV